MDKPPSIPDMDALINGVFSELERQGITPEQLKEMKNLLADEEARRRLEDALRIDDKKMDRATKIINNIQILSTEIVILRLRINENSKIMEKRLFHDNTETSLIGNYLGNRRVTDHDSLHLFIDDLHKYLIQSAEWDDLYDHHTIGPVLNIINRYRQSFDHIYDMKGGGGGTQKAYKEMGEINEELVGHKVIKVEEFPKLQIKILERVKEMLQLLNDNIEEWLSET